jgi:FG-GAP repeat
VEAGDFFGAALAVGDFNNNASADLAVGAPIESVGSAPQAGAVSVLYGSSGAGLSTTGGQLFTQVGDAPEGFDQFGFAVAAGDFNNNGFADLAAGAHFEDVAGADDAGAVSVLYGSAAGLTTAGGQSSPRSAGPLKATTSSAGRWRPETSTTMALPTWLPGPPSRTSPASSTLGRSASCTAPLVVSPPPVGNCSPRTAPGSPAAPRTTTSSVTRLCLEIRGPHPPPQPRSLEQDPKGEPRRGSKPGRCPESIVAPAELHP